MPDSIRGIHHVTGICGNVQQNLDFYTGVLGLRLVKQTVNFDDPGTYHLYYGDGDGRPGTILTFFPWPNASPGRSGAGMPEATAFAIPGGSIEYWTRRLANTETDFDGPFDRMGTPVLRLYDPDNLPIELVTTTHTPSLPEWHERPVPHEVALRGLFGITLQVRDPDPTERLLTEMFRYRREAEEGPRVRFRTAEEAAGNVIELLRLDEPKRPGRGTIHHLALRAENADEQLTRREKLLERGFEVTTVKDRHYFRSIYFREPNGILFEIATDGPGFTVDEEANVLGSTLKLPPWLEAMRTKIEKRLPPLQLAGSRSTY